MRHLKIIGLTLSLTLILAGCDTASAVNETVAASASSQVTSEASSQTSTNAQTNTSSNDVSFTSTASDIQITSSDEEIISVKASNMPSDATKITLDDQDTLISGSGADYAEGIVTISQSGSYVVSGSLTDGQIYVDADDADVVLYFNGVNISNSTSAAVFIKDADTLTITVVDGSVNALEDASEYVYENADEDEPSATLFSKADLVINGSGTLIVVGNYNDAIVSKDTLVITDTSLDIQAVDDGIVGKDQVDISGSEIDIESLGDGIKSSNDEDEGLGNILIDESSINIKSDTDGIQAVNLISLSSSDITVDAGDDALNSDGDIIVDGGVVTIDAVDDAFHAEAMLHIISGQIDVLSSYEGLEGQQIVIDGGVINVKASDDGINAAGGSESGGMGMGFDSASSDLQVVINGGYIYLNADGDGLDSNGYITMNGGEIYVDGPTSNNNGAIDYNGTFVMNDGILVAAGSSGMAQAPSTTSTIGGISMTFTSSQSAGTEVSLYDENDTLILTYTPSKSFQTIVFSKDDITAGSTYTIEKNGIEVVSFTTSDLITYVNESGITAGGSNFGPGGFGGGQPGGDKGGRDRGGMPPSGDQGTFTPPNGDQGTFTPPTNPETDANTSATTQN